MSAKNKYRLWLEVSYLKHTLLRVNIRLIFPKLPEISIIYIYIVFSRNNFIQLL